MRPVVSTSIYTRMRGPPRSGSEGARKHQDLGKRYRYIRVGLLLRFVMESFSESMACVHRRTGEVSFALDLVLFSHSRDALATFVSYIVQCRNRGTRRRRQQSLQQDIHHVKDVAAQPGAAEKRQTAQSGTWEGLERTRTRTLQSERPADHTTAASSYKCGLHQTDTRQE